MSNACVVCGGPLSWDGSLHVCDPEWDWVCPDINDADVVGTVHEKFADCAANKAIESHDEHSPEPTLSADIGVRRAGTGENWQWFRVTGEAVMRYSSSEINQDQVESWEW